MFNRNDPIFDAIEFVGDRVIACQYTAKNAKFIMRPDNNNPANIRLAPHTSLVNLFKYLDQLSN